MSRKLFDGLIAGFIFLSATYFIPGQTFSDAQANLFKFCIPLLFIFSLSLKPLRYRVSHWLNAALALALVGLPFANTQVKGLMIEPLVMFFLAVIFFYLIANYVENRSLIYSAIALVVVVNAIVVLYQIWRVDPICIDDQRKQNIHLVGLFGYKMNLSEYMAMACPLLLFNKRIPFGILAGILCILGRSWGAIGALGVAIVFCIWFWKPKYFVYFLIGLIVAGSLLYFFVLNDPIGNETFWYKLWVRRQFQQKLLRVGFNKPHVGQGIGTFKYLPPELLVDEKLGALTEAWNDYLELFITMGFGILFIIAMLYYDIWNKFRRAVKDNELIGIGGALLTIPIGVIFHTYMNHINLGVICLALLGLFYMKMKEE